MALDPLALIQTEAAAGHQVMHMGVVFERACPGVQYAQKAQGSAQAFGILREILQGLGTGSQEQVVASGRMGAYPPAQAFRNSEGEQEVVDRQEQRGVLLEPLLSVLAAALRAVSVIAGVIAEMAMVAVWTIVQRPAQRGSAASQKALQSRGKSQKSIKKVRGVAKLLPELLQIGRGPSAQRVVNGQGAAAILGGSGHLETA